MLAEARGQARRWGGRLRAGLERFPWINSLSGRIILATALWSALVLPIAGWTLQSIYEARVQQEFDRRLDQLMTLLLASTRLDEGARPSPPEEFGDPLFNLPIKNGWYWQVEPGDGRRSWILMSDSLVGEPLVLPPASETFSDPDLIEPVQFFDADFDDGQRLRIIHRVVTAGEGPGARRFLYTITGNRQEVANEVASFFEKIVVSLALLGAGLLALIFVLLRFGLQPLTRIEAGLAKIRSGEAERLEGDLPYEIRPLQTELNALIQSNQEVVDRARTHVGNLAHALKTPLSVITNEAERAETPLGEKVREQTAVMRDQINHYLDRARMAARVGVIGGVTPVGPAIDALARALRRIHEERGLTIDVVCPTEARFQGEKQDLEELLGNLMDNACKWARRTIRVTVSVPAPARRTDAGLLLIVVEDDGPGLTPAERADAMKRGKRLDETKPGSGLGLSIVRDLTDLYRGSFRLGTARLGGLRAELRLPAAH